ncbi:hypothetical protein [Croceicoccus marinus]|uniref:Uncharacterized protein n=1 Tax=Croceicoccus marinus TaxID=450378 RepID=A0A7G6W1E6_9SPHN|nr:hypothetical protein [Croceicoccus marinus]QNE07811.1 hypothetical protein H4O24_19925 [Croceicoccus marinus]
MHRVHHFGASGAAIAACRSSSIPNGDVILVPHECAAAVATSDPFAVTEDAGEFRTLSVEAYNAIIEHTGLEPDIIRRAVDEALRFGMAVAPQFLAFATPRSNLSTCEQASTFTIDEILLVSEAINFRVRSFQRMIENAPEDAVAHPVWRNAIRQLEEAQGKLLSSSI